MQTFTTLSGPAAALPMINVDTDQLIPKQYLTAISRAGLGKGLFHDFRYDMEDKELPDFVLNREPWREARILIAGENFGCGSSREHAPWALEDFGIRCVIAPSFADIFFNNCVKNGVLLIPLPEDSVNLLMDDAGNSQTCRMAVDLETQTITRSNGEVVSFEIEPFRKHRLLNGLDDIGITMTKAGEIGAFEAAQKAAQPWLYGGEPPASAG
ncbi:MAG: 3-isopropylmalate dehydratase small subunit [Rhodospirillaceae bacterium]|nr:3-isopropylmalate dehydratase small subunit [Rhodospirillaceae bacterium]